MTTQTPIYRAVENIAAHENDDLIRDAAERVLKAVPDFIGVDEPELIELYDRINGDGSFHIRCAMAEGKLSREDIIDRAAVDLAYAYVRELQERAAGTWGLDVMSQLAARIGKYMVEDNVRRAQWN